MISTQVPPEAKTAATLEVFGRAPGDLVEIPVGAKEAWVVGADDDNGEHLLLRDAADNLVASLALDKPERESHDEI